MDETDFSMLYRELGVGPNSGLSSFQRAYRRRLKRLHPDSGHATDNATDLSKLVQHYRRAMAFHQEHGRLPGAAWHPAHSAGHVAGARDLPPMASDKTDRLSGDNRFSRWILVAAIVSMLMLGLGVILPG